MSSRTTAAERARARSTWPIRIVPLGHETSDDVSAWTTAEERLAMTWELTQRAWALAGRPLPDYDRASIPSRLFRPGEPVPDDDW